MAVLAEDRTYDKAASDAIVTFIRPEDAERFVEEVRATIPSSRATAD